MRQIVFEYKGRQHRGQIISSTTIEPHYHWFYFDDEDIIGLIEDDCIGFQKKNDELHPTRIYTRHQELVETVKKVVENNIS